MIPIRRGAWWGLRLHDVCSYTMAERADLCLHINQVELRKTKPVGQLGSSYDDYRN